jgi:2-keto-myo-inositol isomerase
MVLAQRFGSCSKIGMLANWVLRICDAHRGKGTEMTNFDRRRFLSVAGGISAGLAAGHVPVVASAGSGPSSTAVDFRYCLNTSTIREAKLPLPEVIRLTAEAGYTGIEPWIREIDQYVASGGSLRDLRKQLDDCGLRVESAIGFPKWSVPDSEERKAGFEEAKRGMELVRALGGRMIAAPPIGIHGRDAATVPLDDVASRYHDLLELGVSMEVIPQVEIWGSAKNLSRLAEAVYVAVAANHPHAGILPDVYHLYRGGSDFHGLRLLSGDAIRLFHVNDYPSTPARTQLNDSDRVYPGDGVAPLKLILQSLQSIGFRGALSLELFNREYWRQDPAVVARTGLQKMQAAVAELDM